MEGFAGIILRHKETHQWHPLNPKKEPAPGVGPQTRPSGRQDQRSEHLAALQIPHRGQERRKGCSAGDKTKATELFAKMQSVVDTVADKGIFHKNKAARDKSRLSAKVKALATAEPELGDHSVRASGLAQASNIWSSLSLAKFMQNSHASGSADRRSG
jgi:hypothetical protein